MLHPGLFVLQPAGLLDSLQWAQAVIDYMRCASIKAGKTL
jgi:hypothetical protein